jgi:hypothetical protein
MLPTLPDLVGERVPAIVLVDDLGDRVSGHHVIMNDHLNAGILPLYELCVPEEGRLIHDGLSLIPGQACHPHDDAPEVVPYPEGEMRVSGGKVAEGTVVPDGEPQLVGRHRGSLAAMMIAIVSPQGGVFSSGLD